MSHRRRSNDIIMPVAQLAALVVLAWAFVPPLRIYAMVAGVVGLGFGLGLLLYHRNESRRPGQVDFGSRPDANTSATPNTAALPIHKPPQLDTISTRLRTIDWFQFEKVIAAVYQNFGHSVTRRGGANPDGGIDLVLQDASGQTAVQCKHWRSWKVRERTVREFLGAMTHARIPKGIIVTLCGYTDEAKRLADAHSIELIDEARLTDLLNRSNVAHNPAVLAALNDTRKV